ncbi:DUF3800 domain-containing protein [Paludibaculum fermentans]|uniref:DUF3800 domain-containing protein n=1 Tax=Paludibaculum fermentans TaxID=1473598 RepID=UPI003EBA47A0
MIVAYFDESGNDSQSTVFAMAGVYLSHSSSCYFAFDWMKLLKQFDIPEFHASDFHGRRKSFRGWSEARCTDFLEAAIRLLLKWRVKHGGVTISRADFKRSFVDTGFHLRLTPAVTKWKKPYLHAFLHLVHDLREYAGHQARGVRITPVFDECQEFIGQARQEYLLRNKDGKLGALCVGNSQSHVQIQAADLIVWEYRRAHERQLQTGQWEVSRVMEPLLPHMFIARTWTFDYLEYLRERVEAEAEGLDPEAVEFRITAPALVPAETLAREVE